MRDSPPNPAPGSLGGVRTGDSDREIEALLRGGHAEGIAEYGPLPLPFELYASRALGLVRLRLRASGVDPSPARIADALARSQKGDLFLAIACEERVAGAWETFSERYVHRFRALARACGAPPLEADEIAHELPGDLVARPGGGGARTRLGSFDGTARLFTWLSVTVARRVADRFRARRGFPSDAEPDGEPRVAEFPGRSPAATDPAVLVIDDEAASRLGEVLRRTWTDLDARATAVLLLKFRDGLPQRQIAARLGLSDSQVSRILAASLGRVRAAVQGRFLADFPDRWRDGESFWSALREAVARHLQESDAPSEPPSADGRSPTT